MDKQSIINQLKLFEFLKKENVNFNIKEFEKAYIESKKKYTTLCEKCVKWKNLDLPYDCILKPSYCNKNDDDYEIINLYEKLIKNNC